METRLIVLLKYLPQLRAEGVFDLEVDGIKVRLRPVLADEPSKPAEEAPQGRPPERYGFPPGTKMPSLRNR
jgi:hypothetical protein